MSYFQLAVKRWTVLFPSSFCSNSRFLSSTQITWAIFREGSKAIKDFETIRKKRAENKKLSEKRREVNEITDRLVLQVPTEFFLSIIFASYEIFQRLTKNSKRKGTFQRKEIKVKHRNDFQFFYSKYEKKKEFLSFICKEFLQLQGSLNLGKRVLEIPLWRDENSSSQQHVVEELHANSWKHFHEDYLKKQFQIQTQHIHYHTPTYNILGEPSNLKKRVQHTM